MAECPSCSITWYICTKCTGMKLIFPDTFRRNRHHKKFHDKSPSTSQKRSLSAIYDNNSEDDTCYNDQVECESDSVSQPIASSIKEIITPSHSLMQLLRESATDATFNPNDFQHVESQVFFSKEHEATSKGAAYLVGRSQFGLQHDIENELMPVDVLLQIKFVHFVSGLTRNQQMEFVPLISGTVDHTIRNIQHQHPFQCDLPMSHNDIRSMYLEGRDALLPNLPHPVISMVDSHSYVSLFDVISDLLGHGSEVDVHGWHVDNNMMLLPHPPDWAGVECFTQSPRGRAIYEEACGVHHFGTAFLPLWVIEWSDDFEPNSQSKQNRGSVWAKTDTFNPKKSYSFS